MKIEKNRFFISALCRDTPSWSCYPHVYMLSFYLAVIITCILIWRNSVSNSVQMFWIAMPLLLAYCFKISPFLHMFLRQWRNYFIRPSDRPQNIWWCLNQTKCDRHYVQNCFSTFEFTRVILACDLGLGWQRDTPSPSPPSEAGVIPAGRWGYCERVALSPWHLVYEIKY